MPRNSSGNYSLPLPPVVPDTIIESDWANDTLDDLAQAVTDSLDRYGRGGMAGPFRFVDGTVSAPGASWASETTTGQFRISAGVIGMSVLGVQVGQWSANGYTGAITGNSAFSSGSLEAITLTNANGTIAWRNPIAENPPGALIKRAGNVLVLRGIDGVSIEDSTNSIQKLGTFFGPTVSGANNLGSVAMPWGQGFFKPTGNVAALSIDGGSTGPGHPDFAITRTGADVYDVGHGPCVTLINSTNTLGVALQSFGSAFHTWNYNGTAWRNSARLSELSSLTLGDNTGYPSTLPPDIPSVIFRNRNVLNAVTNAGGIFASTFRDTADPHFSAGIWFTRVPQGGNTSSSSDILFGTASSIAANTLPTERMRITGDNFIVLGGGGVYTDTTTQIRSVGLYPLTIRNDARPVGQFWRVGPANANNYFAIYNQSGVGMHMVDGATAWTASSDERDKTDFVEFSDAVAKVLTLRAGIGRFVTDPEGTERSFLMAQDVQEVLPSAVSAIPGREDRIGVAYTDLIPLLVAAIKELNARIP